MPRRNLFNGLMMLVMLAALIFVPAVFAEQATTVQVNGLFVYDQPDPNSTLIAVLNLGTPITVLDDPVQNGFNHIRMPDSRTGWARLDTSGVPKGQVVSETGTGTTTSPTGVVVEARGNVRIRLEPSLGAAQIGLIGWGQRASLLETSANGDWYKIDYQGVVGWSASVWFVTVEGSVAQVPGGTLDTIVDTSILEGVGGGGPAETTAASGVVAFANDSIRIRAEPSLSGERIGSIAWGQTAPVLAYARDGAGQTWILINHQGLVGWSMLNFFDLLTDNPFSVPVLIDGKYFFVDAQGNILSEAPAPSGAGTGTTTTTQPPVTTTTTIEARPGDIPLSVTVQATGNVRIRAEPSFGAPKIGLVPWGATAQAMAMTSNGDWLLINYNGIVGWSHSEWYQVFSGDAADIPTQ